MPWTCHKIHSLEFTFNHRINRSKSISRLISFLARNASVLLNFRRCIVHRKRIHDTSKYIHRERDRQREREREAFVNRHIYGILPKIRDRWQNEKHTKVCPFHRYIAPWRHSNSKRRCGDGKVNRWSILFDLCATGGCANVARSRSVFGACIYKQWSRLRVHLATSIHVRQPLCHRAKCLHTHVSPYRYIDTHVRDLLRISNFRYWQADNASPFHLTLVLCRSTPLACTLFFNRGDCDSCQLARTVYWPLAGARNSRAGFMKRTLVRAAPWTARGEF